MANGFLVLDEKDWEGASQDQRDWMVFKTLRNMDERLSCMERWGWTKAASMFLGSAVGGAFMMLVLHLLKVKPA
jgi:hypothetical protein